MSYTIDENYSKKNLAVYSQNRENGRDFFTSIDGKWRSSLTNGKSGWLVDHTLKKQVEKFIKNNTPTDVQESKPVSSPMTQIKQNAKNRKNQKVYRRAVSEDEESQDETPAAEGEAEEVEQEAEEVEEVEGDVEDEEGEIDEEEDEEEGYVSGESEEVVEDADEEEVEDSEFGDEEEDWMPPTPPPRNKKAPAPPQNKKAPTPPQNKKAPVPPPKEQKNVTPPKPSKRGVVTPPKALPPPRTRMETQQSDRVKRLPQRESERPKERTLATRMTNDRGERERRIHREDRREDRRNRPAERRETEPRPPQYEKYKNLAKRKPVVLSDSSTEESSSSSDDFPSPSPVRRDDYSNIVRKMRELEKQLKRR